MDAGKSVQAHEAVLTGAKVLAGTSCDLIQTDDLLKELWQDFEEAKKNA